MQMLEMFLSQSLGVAAVCIRKAPNGTTEIYKIYKRLDFDDVTRLIASEKLVSYTGFNRDKDDMVQIPLCPTSICLYPGDF